MEILHQYDTEIIKWKHEDVDKFNGRNKESIAYGLMLSPPIELEPDCVYMAAIVNKKTNNDGEYPFEGETRTTFKVRNNKKLPTESLCFDLIQAASREFALIHHSKVSGTNLAHHKIPIPVFDDQKAYIQQCIRTWGSLPEYTLRN